LTCVLPFQFDKLSVCDRVVVEACPGSTLKRLGLPHNRYKQTAPAPVAANYQAVRAVIFDGLQEKIRVSPAQRQIAMDNPGGDALDAIIAAVGTFDAWRSLDAKADSAHPRYRLEGKVYC
jgi:hypothetical protein